MQYSSALNRFKRFKKPYRLIQW